MTLVARAGKLLAGGGKIKSVAAGGDPCGCCGCAGENCKLILRYVDENRCEDAVFDVYAYNPDDGPAARVFIAELDMVSSPPGCCQTADLSVTCPETRVEIPITIDKAYVSEDCRFGLSLVFKRANCCLTYARFSLVSEDGTRELYGNYFTGRGISQVFNLRYTCTPQPTGPGTELKNLLGRFWIRSSPGCKCEERAYKMDQMGPEWCRENKELILTWLEEEARSRGLPYLRAAGVWALETAISRAESAS